MKKQYKHFSHTHALQPYNAQDEEDDEEIIITCSCCEQQLPDNETAYFCLKPECDFYLDKSCFELPKTLAHKSHKKHKLTILSEPPSDILYYDCNACSDLINAFSFHCEKSCGFKLHPKCALLPDTVACKAHDQHELALRHCTPESESTISCDVCDGYVTEGYWTYFCKDCDFVTHLECAFAEEEEASEVEEEEEVSEVEDEEDEEKEVSEVEEEEEEDDKEEVDEEEEEKEDDDQVNEEGKDEKEDDDQVNEEGKDEEEDNEEEEEEDGDLSDARKLQIANMKAMDQMAINQFQMNMAEMNARAVRMTFRTTN